MGDACSTLRRIKHVWNGRLRPPSAPAAKTSNHLFTHTVSAFTLIELSIILVIIGLIIGGVMAGRLMIENATNRKIISELQEYEQAFNAFRLKYKGLPGDISNPDQFWPDEYWERTGRMGGNNNGVINWSYEGPEAWKQLSLSGLMAIPDLMEDCTTNPDIYYSPTLGVAEIDACKSVGGLSSPRSKAVPAATITVMTTSTRYNPGPAIAGRVSGNLLVLNRQQPVTQGIKLIGRSGAVTPHAAFYIDSKLDDGYPITGRLQGSAATLPYNARSKLCIDWYTAVNAATADAALKAPYLLRGSPDIGIDDYLPDVDYSSQKSCSLYYRMAL